MTKMKEICSNAIVTSPKHLFSMIRCNERQIKITIFVLYCRKSKIKASPGLSRRRDPRDRNFFDKTGLNQALSLARPCLTSKD